MDFSTYFTGKIHLTMDKFLCKKCLNNRHKNDQSSQHDSVISKHLEIVLLDISEQEPDDNQRRYKSCDHTDQQNCKLGRRKCQAEFYELQKACAKHNRNREKERKFCRNCSGYTDHQRADDGRTGAGGARKDRCDQLEKPNHECGLK